VRKFRFRDAIFKLAILIWRFLPKHAKSQIRYSLRHRVKRMITGQKKLLGRQSDVLNQSTDESLIKEYELAFRLILESFEDLNLRLTQTEKRIHLLEDRPKT
jgi:hypothetical protein